MLETKGLTKHFGGLSAINNLDLNVNAGEIVGLIGPNGAGKTTLFNLVTGFLHPTSGRILFDGKDIVGQKPHAIARLGMVRTFQLVRILHDFTVLRNMFAASHLYPQIGFWEAILNTSRYRQKEEQINSNIIKILHFVGLSDLRDTVAGNLPHGHQKMLGIALALAAHPKLLLLDEPLGGMNPVEVDTALKLVAEIRKQGTAILLIEHNMRAVMSICDRVVVLNFGTEIARGYPEEVKQNKEVIEAYLGAGKRAAKSERHKSPLRQS
ncbi:MAG: ABC transporter ATP-binding protein [Thermodesulfobacteriota bacterium]